MYEKRLSTDDLSYSRASGAEGARKVVDAPLFKRSRGTDSRGVPAPARTSGAAERQNPKAELTAPIPDAEFKAQLTLLIPHLRAFARSLATRGDGDDIAQEAMLRAWQFRASYQPGTNMKAWAFQIARNHFISLARRAWRNVPLDPAIAENTLYAGDDPHTGEALLDVRNAMQLLPSDQREALILAGPAGLSYDETAVICGCAVGTVKSRVSRARATLARILEEQADGKRSRTSVSATGVFEEIMTDAATTRRRLEAGLPNRADPVLL